MLAHYIIFIMEKYSFQSNTLNDFMHKANSVGYTFVMFYLDNCKYLSSKYLLIMFLIFQTLPDLTKRSLLKSNWEGLATILMISMKKSSICFWLFCTLIYGIFCSQLKNLKCDIFLPFKHLQNPLSDVQSSKIQVFFRTALI